jgi:uncharacterized protein YecE (DUF72 family)
LRKRRVDHPKPGRAPIDTVMEHWIGTSGFQYAEWKGTFYPEKMPTAKMLPYYAERFASTEVNYTFRRFPSEKTINRWVEETPDAFRFSLKAPERITHHAQLKNCEETVHAFQRAVSGLGGKLGPVLFQLPPALKKDTPRLANFLQELPPEIQAAFEFRHVSWFEDEVFDTLHKCNAALCLAESANLATPPVATANFGYLRLRREDYAGPDFTRWAEFVAAQEKQWTSAFIYFKHEESGIGPKFAAEMQTRLG